LIAVADEPRALLGRGKRGSAFLLFKCPQPYGAVPHVAGDDYRNGVFKLSTKDGAVRFDITIRYAREYRET
jgi:hypothetical protein